MAKIIFILAVIVVHILTIVSNKAYFAQPLIFGSTGYSENIAANVKSSGLFYADFESGNLLGWKQNGDWEASAAEKISGSYSLKHSATSTGSTSSIFHSVNGNLNSFDYEWSFKLKNGNWDPSSSNRFWVYLSADTIQADVINGWAVGVNITGSTDLLELWRFRKGKADSLVVQTDFDWNAANLATITVKRTSRGNWTVNYQKTGEATSKSFTGSDPVVFDFKNTGIYFNYTSTRAGQLWIDDVTIYNFASEFYIQKISVTDFQTLSIVFNKAVQPASVSASNFKLSDVNNQQIMVGKAVVSEKSDKEIELAIGKVSGNQIHITISGITDQDGQAMISDTRKIQFSFAPEPGMILINEVLFDPRTGGVDFVELINVSEYTLSAHRIMLAARDDTLALKQIYRVSTDARFVEPGGYLVCTKDPEIVKAHYFWNEAGNFCMMKSFPTYPDDSGTVVLLNDSLKVLDEFGYSHKMHSSFLADEEGVSLERISTANPGSERSNWASAASSVGYASPGRANSQTGTGTSANDEISLETPILSPNSDGYNDDLKIAYKLNKPGYIANVRIFDLAGRQVRYLAKNESLAQEGNWKWDGKNDQGQRLSLGVYLVYVEIFDREGNTKLFKKTCTLTDRLE